ncbi:MAG: GNAT family N-acetyltransferase [Acidimicrobiales bacterium]|nr:GNAT family N-acetyltransferase [Acidimicrobiaceae bacterium]MEC7427962.1 GNAT family N-acetyltransferase [Actinomycetota bacterium]MBR81529.1 GNAT family N-acetyltransferase [Acidimicrobiaceae bacterium]HAE54673.1 GNAT family N-acetyltransferase [Acidimicrobiaceae bacterium]HAQ43782.1 GNAT family N-acetyltransferase [Acidimicrobiaceae bacterium]|tara:strand:+ start:45817 stop:46338 length:522 start_codon:yes stop_codon:yes gene_type:complete
MNPNLLIREAQSSEYETVANLTMAAYRPLFTELDLPEDLGWYGAELRDVAGRAARSEIIVAVTGEQIVGSLAYHDDYSDEVKSGNPRNCAGFRVLATDPKLQGRGVGEALTRWCIERARSDGRTALLLNTTDYMKAAQRLYRRLGFEPYPEIGYEIRGSQPVEVLGFRLELRD